MSVKQIGMMDVRDEILNREKFFHMEFGRGLNFTEKKFNLIAKSTRVDVCPYLPVGLPF